MANGTEHTHPHLKAICDHADTQIASLKRKRVKFKYINWTIGGITILLSIAIAQESDLTSLIPCDGVWILVPYILAVLVAFDKFYGFDRTQQALSQAIATIYAARSSIYYKEKSEITRNSGQPVSPEFAGELAAELSQAVNHAMSILAEKGVL